VIGDRPTDAFHREHAVIAHGEVAPEVVGGNAALDVVRGVDEDSPTKDMRRWICRVDTADERLRQKSGRVRLRGLRKGGCGNDRGDANSIVR
jgi:hypothetical protein